MKTKTIYIANDDKEFDCQEDCKNWENSENLRKFMAEKFYGNEKFKKLMCIENFVIALMREYHIVKRTDRG
jgi:hypothetical protein